MAGGCGKTFSGALGCHVCEIVTGCKIVTDQLAITRTISHKLTITYLNLCDERPPDQKLLTKMLITHKLALVNIFYPL